MSASSRAPSSASLAVALLLATVAGAAPPADAQEADESGVAQARARFGEAVELADQGRYAEALPMFEELQRARPHPVILYNIAWCRSRLGHDAEALEAFEAYLEHDDTSEERLAAARAERDRLTGVVETETPPAPVEVAMPEPPEHDLPIEAAPRRSRRRVHRAWFWTFLGLSLVTGAAATATGVVTMEMRSQWIEEADRGSRDTGLTLRTVTDVLLFTMAAEAIATLVLGLFTNFDQRSSAPDRVAAAR